jgi:hypothetical protein
MVVISYLLLTRCLRVDSIGFQQRCLTVAYSDIVEVFLVSAMDCFVYEKFQGQESFGLTLQIQSQVSVLLIRFLQFVHSVHKDLLRLDW